MGDWLGELEIEGCSLAVTLGANDTDGLEVGSAEGELLTLGLSLGLDEGIIDSEG